MTTTAHFISRTYLFQFWLVLHSETTFKIGDVRNPIVTLSSKDVKYINRLTIVSLVGLKSEMAESLLATYLESSNQVLSIWTQYLRISPTLFWGFHFRSQWIWILQSEHQTFARFPPLFDTP